MAERKPIICLDFDGVIHTYSRGWADGTIYDSVTPGFFAWAIEAQKLFTLFIYSSRSRDEQGRAAMRAWLVAQYGSDEILSWFELTHEKPPAFLTIDDRAIRFTGDWASDFLSPQRLARFQSWVTRPVRPTRMDRGSPHYGSAAQSREAKKLKRIEQICADYETRGRTDPAMAVAAIEKVILE